LRLYRLFDFDTFNAGPDECGGGHAVTRSYNAGEMRPAHTASGAFGL
jgi:hypothetical protein